MLPRKPDDGFINVIVGNSTSRELSELETRLVLIQSACTLALEGTKRATASQIAAKALQDYKVEAPPYYIGQIFSRLNIASVTVHGKSRFVLDASQLEGIRKDLETQCHESMNKLRASVDEFQKLPEKIEGLQKEWKQALATRAREQELIKSINADRQNPPRMDYLEAEFKKIQQRNDYIDRVKKETKELELKEKSLPALKERQEALKTKIADHEKKTQALVEKEREIIGKEEEAARKEATLANRLDKLQQKLGWLELASLQAEIEAAKQELGEKRSLLDIFRRNKGGKS
jgi:DNA repair exonuclease SbcCD ATPase subunit